jgi:2'-5' RNA ligase
MDNSLQVIRTFIAIELPEPVKLGLRKLQNSLKSSESGFAKWVNPDGIHITLKFMGNMDIKNINTITSAIREACKEITPFQIQLQELGAFPSLKRVQIVWVGLTGDLPLLLKLQKNIDNKLSGIGYPKEEREFVPHITLARMRDNVTITERQNLGDVISRTTIEAGMNIDVMSISLMRSELTRSGAIYTRLSSIELNPSCQ